METNVNYALVGLFVISLLAVTILGIIWLSSGFSFEQYTLYMVYMQESVSGLSPDATVEYNGVDVGTVKSIGLNRENPQLVELLLRVKSNTPITQGTVATLNTRGITGLTYIALKDKSTNLEPLSVLPGQSYPVIKTAPSLFNRLDTALSKLANDLHIITESIQSVLNIDNQHSIKKILSNFEQISNTLAANNRQFREILHNTAKASQQFVPLMTSSMQALTMLQMQTLPATYRMVANLDDITRTLSFVTADIKRNPAILIRGRELSGPLGPGETP